MAKELDIGAMLREKFEEQRADANFFDNWGFGANNVKFIGKDAIEVRGVDSNGDTKVKCFTAYEVIDFIISNIESHLNKYKASRDGYFRFCRPEELEKSGIEIKPNRAQNYLYSVIVKAYDNGLKRKDDDYIRNELASKGIEYTEDLFTQSPEERADAIRRYYETVLRSDIAIVMYEIEAARRIYLERLNGTNKKYLEEKLDKIERKLRKEIVEYIDEDEKDEHLYSQIAAFSQIDGGLNDFIKDSYNAQEGIVDQDVFSMLDHFLGKEDISKYVRCQPESIIERKQVIKQLIKKGYITESELKDIVNKGYIFELFLRRKNKDLLKYMFVYQLCYLFRNGEIEIGDLAKNTTLAELITSGIDSKEQMEILKAGNGKRVFNTAETNLIWEYFEKGYFSSDDMRDMEELGYFHINTVIKNYLEERERKIAAELDVIPAVSDIALFFVISPELVIRELRKGIKPEFVKFYNEDLKRIYVDGVKSYIEHMKEDEGVEIKENYDLEEQVMAMLVHDYSINGKDPEKFFYECLDFYSKGFFSVDTLVSIDFPTWIAADYIAKNNYDDKTIIEFFNAGIISQELLLEIYDDNFEEKVFKLIEQGLDASALSGMYSTDELLKFMKAWEYSKENPDIRYDKKLSLEQLAALKDDINTGLDEEETKKTETSILSAYLSEYINYEELRALADAGVISMDEFCEIEDKYNITDALEQLKQKGLFSRVMPSGTGTTTNGGRVIGPISPNYKPSGGKTGNGIDKDLIFTYYEALGISPDDFYVVDATQCPIFDGYIIVPDKKRRICYLEGDEGTRTYIVPLKFIEEQMKHPGSQTDIFGTSKSRREFAQKLKALGASANHTANWGKNMIEKIGEVSPKVSKAEVSKFKKEYGYVIQEIADSYKERAKKQNR